MAAFVTVSEEEPGTGERPPEEPLLELREQLAKVGVVSGIDEQALSELSERLKDDWFECSERQIASGTLPQSGSDGWVEIAFEQGASPGRVSADGHMDFFERGLLKVIEKERVVAIVHAPEPGRAGATVEGQAISARSGTVAKLKLGSGVEADADGVVRALRGGVVLYKPAEALDVVEQHVHQGPVDLRTGHLDTPGSLTVKGDVERLLQARASGDVEVLGSVSGGSLRAGGSVRVSGSVRGGDESRIVAGADATLRSCESADVTALGWLRVQEAVNSSLSAHHVLVTGRMRGGSAVAEASVRVKEAGAAGGATTLLQAGEPLELPDLEQVQRAVMMQKLRRMAERGGVRDAFGSRGDARAKGGKLGRVAASFSAEELQKRAQLAERRAELVRTAYVEVELAHPGVEVRIGAGRLTLDQSVRASRYAWDPETSSLRAERTSG